MHLRRPDAGGRSLLDGEDDRVLQGFARARDHHSDGSGNVAPIEKRNSEQNLYPRSDRELFLWRMPVHENEYTREGALRALEDGAGDHIARAAAQARGSADSSHARVEQIVAARVTFPLSL